MIKTALELWNNYVTGISTGSPRLDEAIGMIRPGSTYLFYGDWKPVEKLTYSLTVNTVKRGKPALILTAIDYHSGSFLDLYDLGYTALQYGLDPDYCLKRVYVANMYNRRHVELADDLVKLSRRIGAGVIILYGATGVFRYWHYPKLLELLGRIKDALREVALVITSWELKQRKYPPDPDGPVYLRHFSNVVVYFKVSRRHRGLVKAYVLKHPWRPPVSLILRLRHHGLD